MIDATEAAQTKPDCYTCAHRDTIPGDAHTSCMHPSSGLAGCSPLETIMAIFAAVGRVNPIINAEGALTLGISANEIGIRRGWFNWPWNFDPRWLLSCNGYTAKGGDRNDAPIKHVGGGLYAQSVSQSVQQ